MQGEGELKVLDRVMHPWADVQPGDRHMIVAGDSDIVLMTLSLSSPDNLYILQEAQKPKSMGKEGWQLFTMSKLDALWQSVFSFVRVSTTGIACQACLRLLSARALSCSQVCQALRISSSGC